MADDFEDLPFALDAPLKPLAPVNQDRFDTGPMDLLGEKFAETAATQEPPVGKVVVHPDGSISLDKVRADIVEEFRNSMNFRKAAIAAVQAQEAQRAEEIRRNTTGPMALVNVLGTLGAQMSQGQDMPGWLQGLGRGTMMVAPPIRELERERVGLAGQVAKMANEMSDDQQRLFTNLVRIDDMERDRELRHKEKKDELVRKTLRDIDQSAAKGGVVTEKAVRARLEGLKILSKDEIDAHVQNALDVASSWKAHRSTMDMNRSQIVDARTRFMEIQAKEMKHRNDTYEKFTNAYAQAVAQKGALDQASIVRMQKQAEDEIARAQTLYVERKRQHEARLVIYEQNLANAVTAEQKADWVKQIANYKVAANEELEELRKSTEAHTKKLETKIEEFGELATKGATKKKEEKSATGTDAERERARAQYKK